MTDVTVRAEQAFEDWAAGEVRTVPVTPRLQTLIDDGRVSVLDTPDPAPNPGPAAEVELPAEHALPEDTGTDTAHVVRPPRRPRGDKV